MEDSFLQYIDLFLIVGSQYNSMEEKGYRALLESEGKYYFDGQISEAFQDNRKDLQNL